MVVDTFDLWYQVINRKNNKNNKNYTLIDIKGRGGGSEVYPTPPIGVLEKIFFIYHCNPVSQEGIFMLFLVINPTKR